jgi:hypothetical protein
MFSKALLANLPFALGASSLSKPDLLGAIAPVDTLNSLSARRQSGMLGQSPSAVSSVAPPLGLNTWSLRALKHDQAIPAILRVMNEAGLRNCQLLFSHAEPEAFDPDFAFLMSAAAKYPTPQQHDQQKRKSEARTAWQLSVPMTYFEALRAQFEQRGLTIRAYASPLGSSEEEIDRVFLMAKTLGASMVITRLVEAQTDLAAAAAERHGLLVGIQFSDQRVLTKQLRASSRLRADPDIGDLTKAGVPALEFIKEHLDSASCIDLKDAVTGGGSVPFGTGGAHMQQVLEFLVHARSQVELYIDCDYPGTGSSTDEVKRCVRYVRRVMSER